MLAVAGHIQDNKNNICISNWLTNPSAWGIEALTRVSRGFLFLFPPLGRYRGFSVGVGAQNPVNKNEWKKNDLLRFSMLLTLAEISVAESTLVSAMVYID